MFYLRHPGTDVRVRVSYLELYTWYLSLTFQLFLSKRKVTREVNLTVYI